MMVEKVHSFSTFPKTTTIANSTSLKYFKNFIFQNHTRGKPFPHLSGWIAIMRSFQGNFNIGFHGGHKKTKLLFK
jgi:hypothetical protein